MTITETNEQVRPYGFDTTHTCENAARADEASPVAIAGRLRRRRDMGGVVFADLEDEWNALRVTTGDGRVFTAGGRGAGRTPTAESVWADLTDLAGLHARGLVHRDIKPSNVIFVNGVPKLADIGLVSPAAPLG